MAKTAEEVEEKQDQQNVSEQQDSKTQGQSAEFPEAPATDAEGAAGGSIDILLDVNIAVTVAIGQTEIPVRKLLQLRPGSVLKLDKSVDAPVDLYLKDTKFATGDIVIVDDQFAVRINQILGLGDSAAKPEET